MGDVWFETTRSSSITLGVQLARKVVKAIKMPNINEGKALKIKVLRPSEKSGD